MSVNFRVRTLLLTVGNVCQRIATTPIKNYQVVPVTPIVQHAEGPVWDPRAGVLYYVDTFKATAYRWDPKNNLVTSNKLEGRNSIGTIMPIRNKPSQFIVSADRYIYRFEWNGLNNNVAKVTELVKIEEAKPSNQFNDGKADVNGNIWLGTLTRQEDLGVTPNGGSLYKFVPSQNFTYTEILSNVSISNGITWTRDNKYMFFIDSSTRRVEKWEFGPNSTIGKKMVLLDLAQYPEIEGIPDGMTSDSQDNLFVAIHGGSCVLKVHPATGKLLQIIKIPAKYVTSATFGGPDMDILYVTTSRLQEKNLPPTSKAGAIFAVTGLGTTGLPMFEPVL